MYAPTKLVPPPVDAERPWQRKLDSGATRGEVVMLEKKHGTQLRWPSDVCGLGPRIENEGEDK